jgi:hypothetical protein
MLRTIHELLCATRRNRLVLSVAAGILSLIMILILLEISYREEEAREASRAFTSSLSSSPRADPPKLKLGLEHPQWTPLAPPIVPLAPPPPTAVAEPSLPEPAQAPAQRDVGRDPVPLPRSRPNRF